MSRSDGSWPPAFAPRRPGTAAPRWAIRIPWIVLAVCWIGFLANLDSWTGLHWISALWFACFFVLVPLALLATVRAVRLRERGLTVFGIVTTLVCLPGWGLAVLALSSSL